MVIQSSHSIQLKCLRTDSPHRFFFFFFCSCFYLLDENRVNKADDANISNTTLQGLPLIEKFNPRNSIEMLRSENWECLHSAVTSRNK